MFDRKQISDLLADISVLCSAAPETKERASSFRRASKFALSATDPKNFVKILRASAWAAPDLIRDIEFILQGTMPEPFYTMFSQYPQSLLKLPAIKSITPSTAFRLYQQYGIASIEDLETAIMEGRGQQLGFYPEQLSIISDSIESRAMLIGKKLWFRAWLKSVQVEMFFKATLKTQCTTVGDVRFGMEFVESIDFITERFDVNVLASSQAFGAMPTISNGVVMVTTADGFNCRFFMVNPDYFGTAVLFASSPKEHIEKLGEIALARGFLLNYTGLFDGAGNLLPASYVERDIYSALGVNYVSCEQRINNDYLYNQPPAILSITDIMGEAHNHSLYSDGASSFEDYIEEAKINKWQWMFLGDHITQKMNLSSAKSSFERSRSLTESRMLVLRSFEADINFDGDVNLPKEYKPYCDMLLASVHEHTNMGYEQMTARLLKAVSHPDVDVLSHPFGRILGKTRGYGFDTAAVFKACAENKVLLEINGAPERQDLSVEHVKEAKSYGCKFILSTDAHSAKGLLYIMQALKISRRAGLEAKDIFNTLDCDGIRTYLQNGHRF